MSSFALRNYGPRVFVSYSFRDKDLAERISAALAESGFQVHREDEFSLAGQQLSAAIPQRIGDAEVLIQLLTANSNASEWVAREFAYAVARRDQKHDLIILPIVFDKEQLPEPVRDWWFFDLSGMELSDVALAKIKEICLSSVYLLPLDEEAPWRFREEQAAALLAGLQKIDRRVIVDSNGLLLRWNQETIDHYSKVEGQYRDQFIEQERRQLARLTRRLKVQDEIVRRLALEIMRIVPNYTNAERLMETALRPLQIFAAIVIGDAVVEAAAVAPPAPHPLRGEHIDKLSAANTANHSSGFCNPGFYRWALGAPGNDDDIVEMGMDASGFQGIKVLFPEGCSGAWPMYIPGRRYRSIRGRNCSPALFLTTCCRKLQSMRPIT
ncbi:MAG: toll/interleukin-1 receptor domain-containing protein [Reyranella sp.]|nr:toll/interleukin-1 receptor domain-containing protein [Reyranella sp.]MBL6652671.1 toll/interleukin-1 receptor domain-containing protein [Reyranella sp.]